TRDLLSPYLEALKSRVLIAGHWAYMHAEIKIRPAAGCRRYRTFERITGELRRSPLDRDQSAS
ncbi:MAG: hypothetical protein ACI9U6_003473, partial [Loktanella salsilacus]